MYKTKSFNTPEEVVQFLNDEKISPMDAVSIYYGEVTSSHGEYDKHILIYKHYGKA